VSESKQLPPGAPALFVSAMVEPTAEAVAAFSEAVEETARARRETPPHLPAHYVVPALDDALTTMIRRGVIIARGTVEQMLAQSSQAGEARFMREHDVAHDLADRLERMTEARSRIGGMLARAEAENRDLGRRLDAAERAVLEGGADDVPAGDLPEFFEFRDTWLKRQREILDNLNGIRLDLGMPHDRPEYSSLEFVADEIATIRRYVEHGLRPTWDDAVPAFTDGARVIPMERCAAPDDDDATDTNGNPLP
jgi:hypothetical protein